MLKQILEAINPPKSYKELALRHDPVIMLDFINGDYEPDIVNRGKGSLTEPLHIDTKVDDLRTINSIFIEYSISSPQSNGTILHYGNDHNNLRIYVVSDLLMVEVVFQDVSYSLVADHMDGMRVRLSLIKDDDCIKLLINEMPLDTIPAIESSHSNGEMDGWLSLGQMKDGSAKLHGEYHITHLYVCDGMINKQSVTDLA